MDDETREEFRKIHERFDGVDKRFDGVDEKLDDIENKMDHGFSALLPDEQWPPDKHDLQRAEIRRKL